MKKSVFKTKCFYLVLSLSIIIIGLLIFTHYELNKARKLIGGIEYYDSINRYNKVYYEKSFSSLKKENRQLYDSLKEYKDQISYLVQFTHEKNYNSGKVSKKPTVIDTLHDTIVVNEPLVAKTYQYQSEPNDTFQYKLNVNSYTEPNWYTLQANVKNKFTIVNKEDGNGFNHLTIGSENGGTISDVTAFKKKESFWNKVSIGPSITGGYDIINKQWGVMCGASVSIKLK